jgi:hypothetical protein
MEWVDWVILRAKQRGERNYWECGWHTLMTEADLAREYELAKQSLRVGPVRYPSRSELWTFRADWI